MNRQHRFSGQSYSGYYKVLECASQWWHSVVYLWLVGSLIGHSHLYCVRRARAPASSSGCWPPFQLPFKYSICRRLVQQAERQVNSLTRARDRPVKSPYDCDAGCLSDFVCKQNFGARSRHRQHRNDHSEEVNSHEIITLFCRRDNRTAILLYRCL
jgi:hypothetical protein